MASVPEAVPQDPICRYSNVAVTIHWVTVVLVLAQLWLGFSFADMAQGPERAQLFTWHRTVGAMILVLVLAVADHLDAIDAEAAVCEPDGQPDGRRVRALVRGSG